MAPIGAAVAAAMSLAWLIVGFVKPVVVRRWGAGCAALAVMAAALHFGVALLAAAALTIVVWLTDRGVPANRARPWWLIALYALASCAWVVGLVRG